MDNISILEMVLASVTTAVTAVTGVLVSRNRKHAKTIAAQQNSFANNFNTLAERMDAFNDRLVSERAAIQAQLDQCRTECLEHRADLSRAQMHITELERKITALERNQ